MVVLLDSPLARGGWPSFHVTLNFPLSGGDSYRLRAIWSGLPKG